MSIIKMISPQIKLLICTFLVLALVYYFFVYKEQHPDSINNQWLSVATTTTKKKTIDPPATPTLAERPILADVYPVLPTPGYTDESYSTEWEGYPIHAANSIETTNYRYWSTPENGTCVPADMCYGLYGTLPPREPPAPLVAPEINDERRRVGFYQTP